MAIFDGKNLKVSIGNLVFSQHGKKTVVKSKPGVGGVRQTAATKKSASVFGKHISPFAKQIRLAFNAIHQGLYDGTMVNRMNSAISTVIHQHLENEDEFNFNEKSFQRLEGFDFNIHSPLYQSLLVKPDVFFYENHAEFCLPSFSISKNIRFPKNYTACTLQIQVALINKAQHRTFFYPIDHILLHKYSRIFEGIKLSYDFGSGELVLIGIAMQFSESSALIHQCHNGKLFHPSGIVAAWLVG